MHAQNSVSSAMTSQIMERMRSLGSFAIAKQENRGSQIVERLKLSDIDDSELVDGFFQLVEEGKIRESVSSVPLGEGGSTTPETVYEQHVVYSLFE